MNSADFIVARHDLQQCRFIEIRLPDATALPDEALLVRVDRFVFTANNISYAVLGDELKYWRLFPAPENFGNIPVWEGISAGGRGQACRHGHKEHAQ